MVKTAVVFTPKYFLHNPGRTHPESAERLRVMISEVEESGLLKTGNCSLMEPKPARIGDVELVHDVDYIKLIDKVCKSGGGLLDRGDTVASSESFDVALHAVGGVLEATELVMHRKFQNAFALVRPPGHHAGPYRACGFCIFNNVAIAATHLLERFNLKRVLILDIDAHHGNGTQEIFYSSDKVLYISLHQDPRGFPGTGFVDEVGEGEGLGYNVNIPFPFRTGDQNYLAAVSQIVAPIIEQYKPQFMLASVGFDGHYADPIASLSLSALCYHKVFERILNLASRLCSGRFVAVLEGGYALSFVGKMAAAAIAQMSGTDYKLTDKIPTVRENVCKQGEIVIKEVMDVQGSFWEFHLG
jgi:acetoin utilization deacetylase AcuC-like enzyme